ncbi:hypothetical protein ACFLTQ_02150 [Chloroflexota bacterium]
MSIGEVISAALIAGVIMALANEVGYRAGIIRGNLLQVDGEFALRQIGRESALVPAYVMGIIVHLITSAAFGLVLYAIAEVIDVDADSVKLIAPYVFFLWLAMLFVALPVAGQGFLGKRLANTVWIEQLFLHFIFGLSLWWILGTLY